MAPIFCSFFLKSFKTTTELSRNLHSYQLL
ncbi:MAG: hypothetical protein QOE98_1982 [Gaiellaceae bacterium]|nr:hypothetical protein [Gaiellaceae bacterium]